MEINKSRFVEFWCNFFFFHTSWMEKNLDFALLFYCKLLKCRQHLFKPLIIHMTAVENAAEIAYGQIPLFKLSLKPQRKAVKDDALKHIRKREALQRLHGMKIRGNGILCIPYKNNFFPLLFKDIYSIEKSILNQGNHMGMLMAVQT